MQIDYPRFLGKQTTVLVRSRWLKCKELKQKLKQEGDPYLGKVLLAGLDSTASFQLLDQLATLLRKTPTRKRLQLNYPVLNNNKKSPLKLSYLGRGNFGAAYRLQDQDNQNYVLKVYRPKYKDIPFWNVPKKLLLWWVATVNLSEHGMYQEAANGLYLSGKKVLALSVDCVKDLSVCTGTIHYLNSIGSFLAFVKELSVFF